MRSLSFNRAATALAIIAAAHLAPASAAACTPPAPGVFGPGAYNATDGAPRNVQLRLQYEMHTCLGPCDPLPDTLQVVRHDDPTMAIAGTTTIVVEGYKHTLVWTPMMPLDATTAYDVVAGHCDGAHCPVETVATFTTGTVIDTIPPTAPGVPEVTCAGRDSCDSSSCCGPYDGTVAWVTLTGGTDDVGVVAYDVYSGATLVATHVYNGVVVTGSVVLTSNPGFRIGSAVGLRAVAVDAAGNTSPPSAPVTSPAVACSTSIPDAGAPRIDGGHPSDAGTATGGDSATVSGMAGGCAVAAPLPALPAALAFSLALLALRRSRRRT